MSNDVPEISVRELKERLDRGDPVRILDVRDPAEWQISNLEDQGARLLPMSELVDRIAEIERDRDVVVQCRSGNRSAQVTAYLRARGYDRVYNLAGGILAWSDEIDSTKKKY